MKVTPGTTSLPEPPAGPPGEQQDGHLPTFIVLFVIVFFGVLALWGVAAATITAVAIAVVIVLRGLGASPEGGS